MAMQSSHKNGVLHSITENHATLDMNKKQYTRFPRKTLACTNTRGYILIIHKQRVR